MSDIDARINLLRLALEKANAIYSSSETHDLLERVLGDVWDDAVKSNENKTNATKFLLTPFTLLEGKSPFDVVLSGDVGKEKYDAFLQTLYLPYV